MSDTVGQLLRGAREARGESLDDIERVTHIRVRQLTAIEADDLGALPSPAQARGYIKNYAQHLGLDLQEVLALYEAAQKARPASRGQATQPPHSRPNLTGTTRASASPQRPVAPPRARPGQPATQPAPTAPPAPTPARGQVRTRRPRLLSADVLVATVITLLLVALLVWGGSRLATGLTAATVTATASFASGLTTTGPTDSPTAPVEATATLDLPSPAASYSGVNLSVRRQDDTVAAAGENGEICARGGNFMREYWKQPEMTEKAFRGGWYRTGDAGHVDTNGYLYLVDRVKDMIVTGGENVYSIEVENAISTHPSVEQIAVIGIPHAVWGEQVHAIVVLRPGHTATQDEIKEHARASIAGYKVPKSVEFRADPIPLSGALKPLKLELRKPYWEGHDSLVS